MWLLLVACMAGSPTEEPAGLLCVDGRPHARWSSSERHRLTFAPLTLDLEQWTFSTHEADECVEVVFSDRYCGELATSHVLLDLRDLHMGEAPDCRPSP